MARQKTKRRSDPADTGKLVLTIVVGAISLAAAVFGAYVIFSAPALVKRDQTTMCPIDRPPSEIVVILLDTTSQLKDVTKAEVFRYLSDIVESLPENGQLDIKLLDPQARGGREVATVCNPGDGSGVTELNGNPALAKKKWEEKYRDRLRQAISSNLSGKDSSSSPLLGTIQSIAVEKFTGKSIETLPKRLIIVSDMIEHTGDYSQYRGDLRYDRFKQSAAYKKYTTDLKGAGVQIFYIQREARIDSGKHIEFWIQWTQDNKGRFLQPRKMQGI